MDGHAATGDERTLRRIMALLVALAALAERVADRSAPVRWLVLWMLRRAETVTKDFVFEETGTPAPAVEGIVVVANGPEDALHLAAWFRALAAALGALLPVAGLPGGRFARRDLPFGYVAPGDEGAIGGRRRKPNDTS